MAADRSRPSAAPFPADADASKGSRSNARGVAGVEFAEHDTEMFDVEAVPITTREARTVGEMLADVDHQARVLLLDVEGDHASGLIRSWPDLVNAAGDLWASLPRITGAAEYDRPMERLCAHAAGIENSLSLGWPGHGARDARVALMTETLREAGRLVHRYGSQMPTHSPLVRRDLAAIRVTTVHTLYVVAHAGAVSLQSHGRDRYWETKAAGRRATLSQLHPPYVVAPTGAWFDKFVTAEAVAGRYLTRRYPSDLAGTAPPDDADQHRVARALAGWDIQAHRSLASRICAADHATISRTQSLIADLGATLVAAARDDATTAEPLGLKTRQTLGHLEPPLQTLSLAWANLASRWGDLSLTTDRPDPRLDRAAGELRAAFRQLTHDAASPLPPAAIAKHPGLAHAMDTTLAAIETSADLADVLLEKAGQPGLVGPARALSRRAHNDIEAGLVFPSPPGDVVWVSPGDIHAKRLVPLPEPVALGLIEAGRRCVAASERAASAMSAAQSSPPVAPSSSHALDGNRRAQTEDRICVMPGPPQGNPCGPRWGR